jgi:hypothetical protein
MRVCFPFTIVGAFTYFFDKRSKNQSPYLFYFVIFYTGIMSEIGHKENRFILIVYPMLLSFMAYLIVTRMGKWTKTVVFFIIVHLSLEVYYYRMLSINDRYLVDMKTAILQADESLVSRDYGGFDWPYYSMVHRLPSDVPGPLNNTNYNMRD